MTGSASEAMLRAGRSAILYDAARVTAVSADWFCPAFWQQRRAVTARYGGRGTALAVDSEAGPLVLKTYLRGGLMARFNHDRYLLTGVERSRSLREWRLLNRLCQLELPVPRPVKAACFSHGLVYRASLLTAQLPDVQPLTAVAANLGEPEWLALADTLKRFFQAGLKHPDLNASNLLLSANGQWYLVDLDRATLAAGPSSPRPMLDRLHRSLEKHRLGGSAAVLFAAFRDSGR
ncbi:MAG: 3-deoxy-D-manno-octulosonic acid kinase [Wenzhouxiangella sp.]